MTKKQIKTGDVLGDCPTCHAPSGIVYHLKGDAVCTSCKSVFRVSPDENEEFIDVPPQDEKPEPKPKPKQPKPPKKADNDDGIPGYIKKSSAWRWAQILENKGNPYRSDSKTFKLFKLFEDEPTTVVEAVTKCQTDLVDNIKTLQLLHDMLVRCLSAGLLVMNKSTGKISVCTGEPVPCKVS